MEIYDLKIRGLDTEWIDMSTFRHKKLIIVNVASECGFTPQYSQLQELYTNFSDRLEILACPCNDFGGQEPGTATDIKHFCQLTYGTQFLMTEKLGIINDKHPLYQWLDSAAAEAGLEADVNWNFCKYIIDENGRLTHFFPSAVSPIDPQILDLIS